MSNDKLVPQGGSQKSKVLWNKLFRTFQWSAYFRRPVLGGGAPLLNRCI
ncbi:MAG: hypothetical protein KME50_30405 [Nostoc desertorum CM1-VF14]|nr:hypothetical protein [Nostoc desertorum CM1-VF14]